VNGMPELEYLCFSDEFNGFDVSFCLVNFIFVQLKYKRGMLLEESGCFYF